MSSELFNLFKLVNGGRRDGPNNHALIDQVKLSHLASTIESKGIYGFDDYGRFKKASESDCIKCLAALAEYGRFRFTHIFVPESYLESISGPNASREWHLFGWLSDDLPDFAGIYANWMTKHGVDGAENLEGSFYDNSANKKSWDLFYAGLTTVIYQLDEFEGLTFEKKSHEVKKILKTLISDEKCSHTQKIIKQFDLAGFEVHAQTLRQMVRSLPPRLLK
jgi:hypothetical protein